MLKRVLSICVLFILASEANAAVLAPHRAVYDLKLLRSSEGAQIAGATGRMAYEVQGSACDGWTVSFRLVNEFSYREGEPRLIDTRSSSWETGDGLEMNYQQTEFVNNQQAGEKKVSVTRPSETAPAKGVINLPANKTFSLAQGVIFPMRHQLRLMDGAERGETRDVSIVYDGSDEDKTVKAISTIGRKVEAGASKADSTNPKAAPLNLLPSWPVTIGYYSTTEDSETPIYQISFDMYENGVSTGLILDYGDFALQGDLAELELLKAEKCE